MVGHHRAKMNRIGPPRFILRELLHLADGCQDRQWREVSLSAGLVPHCARGQGQRPMLLARKTQQVQRAAGLDGLCRGGLKGHRAGGIPKDQLALFDRDRALQADPMT